VSFRATVWLELPSNGNDGEGWFQIPSVKAGLQERLRFFIFFNVPDLMTAVARVKELGGETDAPGPDEPGFGRFCTCRDPQGIRFGLHQPPKGWLGSHSPSQAIVSLNLCCPCVSSYIFYHSVATVPKIQTCFTYLCSRRWMATEIELNCLSLLKKTRSWYKIFYTYILTHIKVIEYNLI